MSSYGTSRFTVDWLSLREEADAAARADELVGPLRAYLAAAPGDPAGGEGTAGAAPRVPPGGTLVIRDLGCGTGSMGRWLAGRLPGPQHWILHDHDGELLARAAANLPPTAADGAPVTTETREGDLTGLSTADLAATSLVTASALLDLLTFDEVDRLATVCAEAGCPALLTLSVAGEVELDPADPLDAEVAAAFDAHQRRSTGGRRLLGPDAVAAATAVFERCGASVRTSTSPWRLGPDRAALTAEWLRGWVGAACEQRPELAPAAEPYLRRRLDACADGALRAVVGHQDLLALPPAAGPAGTADNTTTTAGRSQ